MWHLIDVKPGDVGDLRDPTRTLIRAVLATSNGRRVTVSEGRLAGSVAVAAV